MMTSIKDLLPGSHHINRAYHKHQGLPWPSPDRPAHGWPIRGKGVGGAGILKETAAKTKCFRNPVKPL